METNECRVLSFLLHLHSQEFQARNATTHSGKVFTHQIIQQRKPPTGMPDTHLSSQSRVPLSWRLTKTIRKKEVNLESVSRIRKGRTWYQNKELGTFVYSCVIGGYSRTWGCHSVMIIYMLRKPEEITTGDWLEEDITRDLEFTKH